jgi:hypothetical protein
MVAIQPGYASTISIGGTPTAVTGEATSLFSGAGDATVRQITNPVKWCMDSSVAVVVKDGVGTVAAASYKIEPLFGKIRFVSYTPSGAITVDYTYIPLLAVAGCRAFNPNVEREKINVTVFSQGTVPAGEDFILGEKMASGEIDYLEAYAKDHDSGGGTVSVKSLLEGSTAVLLDARLGSIAYVAPSANGFRAWALLHGFGTRVGESGASERKIKWQAMKYGLLDVAFAFAEDFG